MLNNKKTPYNKIFEDENFIVIDKLIEIPVLAILDKKKPALSNFTSIDFPETKDLPDYGFTHRLDNKTKGLLLIAKKMETYETIRDAFTKHLIEKTYLARVKEKPPQNDFIISFPIAHDKNKKSKMIAVKDGYRVFRSKPRYAKSIVKLINTTENYSDLEIKTNFGLRHQIRVHLASYGFPILGDNLYGKSTEEPLMLIAKSLKLDIGDKEPMCFVSNLNLNII